MKVDLNLSHIPKYIRIVALHYLWHVILESGPRFGDVKKLFVHLERGLVHVRALHGPHTEQGRILEHGSLSHRCLGDGLSGLHSATEVR